MKKKFSVSEDCRDAELKLVVDMDVLTPKLATEINNFLSGAEERLETEDGDVVRVVIRLFAEMALRYFSSIGGGYFRVIPESEDAKRMTQGVLEFIHEGWPPFDELGIVFVEAHVAVPEFDDLTLAEAEEA